MFLDEQYVDVWRRLSFHARVGFTAANVRNVANVTRSRCVCYCRPRRYSRMHCAWLEFVQMHNLIRSFSLSVLAPAIFLRSSPPSVRPAASLWHPRSARGLRQTNRNPGRGRVVPPPARWEDGMEEAIPRSRAPAPAQTKQQFNWPARTVLIRIWSSACAEQMAVSSAWWTS